MLALFLFIFVMPNFVEAQTVKKKKRSIKNKIQRLNRQSNQLDDYEIDATDLQNARLYLDNNLLYQTVSNDSSLLINNTTFRVKVNNWLDFRVLNDITRVRNTTSAYDESGFMPLTIGTRIVLKQAIKQLPEIGFEAYFTLPKIGAEAFRTLTTAPIFFATFEHTLSDKWSIAYNVGLSFDGETKVPYYNIVANTTYNFSDKLSLYADYIDIIQKGSLPYQSVDLGASYDLTKSFSVNITAGTAINAPVSDLFANLGFSWSLPKLKRKIQK